MHMEIGSNLKTSSIINVKVLRDKLTSSIILTKHPINKDKRYSFKINLAIFLRSTLEHLLQGSYHLQEQVSLATFPDHPNSRLS